MYGVVKNGDKMIKEYDVKECTTDDIHIDQRIINKYRPICGDFDHH